MAVNRTQSRPSMLIRSLLAGLVAGGIAAVIASLISLPLDSPDDAVLNSGTVAIASVVAGLVGGLLWNQLARRGKGARVFHLSCGAAFLAVVIVTLISEAVPAAPLERVAQYVIPLAAIAIGIIAIGVPLVVSLKKAIMPPALVSLAAGLAVGLALSGQGDAPSGKLSLGDLVSLPTPTPQASFAPTATPVPTLAPTTSANQTALATQTSPATATVSPTPAPKPDFIVALGKGTYTVREKLSILPASNDAVGATTVFSGEINLDGRPSKILADLRALRSDQTRRDQFIQGQTLQTRTFPFAEFTVTDVRDFAERLARGETVAGKVTGTMKIRGVERPFIFDLKEARLSGGVLQLLATVDFTWADFNIPPPNIPGTVQVENAVHLEVVIEARRPA